MRRKKFILIVFFSVFLCIVSWDYVLAEDFILGPAKVELLMGPGESIIKNLFITNQLGRTMNFKVEIEDVQGSQDGETAVLLLGQERGPYSLKNFLYPEIAEFTLTNNERMILPVEISIPESAEPGGLYGSVLISALPLESDEREMPLRLIGRIGTVFFLRVKGQAKEAGTLERFSPEGLRKFYQKGPIAFSILFRNKGNVHLNPYGIIEIKNLLGKKIDNIEIDPYFALPNSLRHREIIWDEPGRFGRYTALLFLNRGYKDIIDKAEISFWIIPRQIVAIIGIGIGIIILVLIVILSRRRRILKI